MKIVVFLLSWITVVNAAFEYKGTVGTFYQQNFEVKSGKDTYITDVRAGFDATYENGDETLKGVVNIDAVLDSKDSARRYLYLNQAYVSYLGETYLFEVGNMIKRWGILEGYSPNDIYNVLNIIKDPLSPEKLGSLGLFYTQFIEDNEFSIGARVLETLQTSPYTNSPYYVFNTNDTFNALDSSLNFFRPTIFIRYTGIFETDENSIDYGVSVVNGFDTMRGAKLLSFNSSNNSHIYAPKLFYSTKLMGYLSIPVDNTQYKSEIVLALSEDATVAHYAQIGLGLEHITDAWFDASLIYLAEYHYFYQSRSTNTLSDIELFQLFQNDAIFGVRVAFNDIYNSALQLGFIADFEYLQSSFQMQYSSKFSDVLGFDIKLTKVNPTTTAYETLYRKLGDFTALSFLLKYTY